MSLSTKILVWLDIIFVIALISFVIYNGIENSNRQKAIETQITKQKDLIDGITRSMNEYATKKDIEQFIKDSGLNLKAIQDDLNKLNAQITAVNSITVTSNGYQNTNVPSTNVGPNNPNIKIPTVNCNGTQIPCPNIDLFGYMRTRQNISLYESFDTLKIPIGEVGFSSWQDKPWNINILPREYNVTSVVGIDENQRQYFYNKFTIKIDNKNYDVKITNAVTKQEYPEAKFDWWNPRLFLTTGASVNFSKIEGSVNVGSTLGIISYGKFKDSPVFSILQVGAAYQSVTKNVSVIINPFNYNISDILPKGLINNTYIGPSTQINITGNVFLGGNLSVGF